MNICIFVCFRMTRIITLVVFAFTLYQVLGDDLYTDRYDNINIEEILSNRRLLIPYVKCILQQGRCTPEGKELKCKLIILSIFK